MRALAVVSEVPIEGLENVPLITATSADYKKFLPWGPFYGVFVKKETPDAAKKALVDAFKKGVGDPKAQEFIKNFGSIYMGISGDEARSVPEEMAVDHVLAPPGCGRDQVFTR